VHEEVVLEAEKTVEKREGEKIHVFFFAKTHVYYIAFLKEIAIFVSNFICQTNIPAKEKKHCMDWASHLLSKQRWTFQSPWRINKKMVTTIEYKRPFYLCSETMRVNLSMNCHVLTKSHPGLFCNKQK